MDEIGEVIRKILKAKHMSSSDLGRIIDLNPRTIANVIHGKSRKLSLLKKISEGLGVNLLQYVIQDEKLNIKHEADKIDIIKYSKASNLIANLVKSKKLACNKEQLSSLINLLYDFLSRKHNEQKVTVEDAFIEGMLMYGIKNFLLSFDKSEHESEGNSSQNKAHKHK